MYMFLFCSLVNRKFKKLKKGS